MWPLEIVGPAMRTFGHLTPHAWAVDAWTDVISRGDHVAQILVPLAVLVGSAVVLITVASARLRRVPHRVSGATDHDPACHTGPVGN